jgi:hypothetical protein
MDNVSSKICEYEYDGDPNGALHFLGTLAETQPWRNPADRGLVHVTASSIADDAAPITAIVGRKAVRWASQNERGQFVQIELIGSRLAPTA